MQLKPIAGQVVVVAGASSGIGRETALEFARRGAKLVVAARGEKGLETLVQEIRAGGGEAISVVADVSEFERVKAIADRAVETYGRIDTWVHAAATGIFAPFDEMTPEEFKRVIDVNLMGQVYGAMVALPHLKREGKGALIHISSIEGRRALPLQSAYASSKHGIEGFLEALRLELKHEGIPISVTSIKPGVINTPFYNNALTKIGVKPKAIPPFYQPSLVVDSILYAAEHPTRDMIISDAGKILDVAQRISPGLVDSLLLLVGFPGQRTDEPKSPSDPHNVYEPTDDNRVKGDFDHLAIPSFLDWFDRHPTTTALVVGAAVAAVSLLAIGWGKTDPSTISRL
jgi:NAD(P)-dependent dehydrogenase (short-subunit alcohol dehydrogenase family)